MARPGWAAGTAAVSGPVGTARVAPAPLDTVETSPADPRWPAQDPRWAHRRAPSLDPLTRTWKTSYGGRRDNDNRSERPHAYTVVFDCAKCTSITAI